MSELEVPRELLVRYATSAPRYTSYPTAVDWAGNFDPATYGEHLARAGGSGGPLSVYVHIPYCAERCLFCGCNVVITRNRERVERYLESLERELAFLRASGIGERPVMQLHWGGGTPTHLTPEEMERLWKGLTATFTLDEKAEIAIEADPRVTTPEHVTLLGELGFNRFSLGIQDFDPAVQEAIKRVQSFEATRSLIEAARGAGMQSVNVDLIYGLPHQHRAQFDETVAEVLTLEPDRVALFHYAHVPWIKKHQTAMDASAMPDSEEKLEIFLSSLSAFRRAGYVYVGLDHFAAPGDEMAEALRDGTLGRNFMGYTTQKGEDLLALGCSAIGEVDGIYVQNSPDEREYEGLVEKQGHAVLRGHALGDDDRLRRDVILGLMCRLRIDVAAVERDHGISFAETFATELSELEPLRADGLLTIAEDELRVTELGQLFLRNIALPFDRYFRDRAKDAGSTFSKTL